MTREPERNELVGAVGDLLGLLRNWQLLVGFSGGADSTALLLACQEAGVAVRAVHFNHQLRENAAGDARWCRQFCRVHEIPFELELLDVPHARTPGESIEMAARRLRLAAWQRRCQGSPTAVLLGHHQDDVLETALMRFLRGANSGGIVGLQPDAVVSGVRLLRPFLRVRRSEIEAYLTARKVTPREDESNGDERYERNRVRRVLRELCTERERKGILRTSELLAQDDAALRAWAEERIDLGADSIALCDLQLCPDALWPRILRGWLEQAAGIPRPMRGSTLRELRRSLRVTPATGWKFDTGVGITLRICKGRVLMEQTAALAAADFLLEWNWKTESQCRIPDLGIVLQTTEATPEQRRVVCERFSLEQLACPLTVRSRQPGDALRPFGSDQSVRLKSLLEGAGQPRPPVCVVCAPDGTIIWVPWVRRAEFGRVQTGKGCLQLVACLG